MTSVIALAGIFFPLWNKREDLKEDLTGMKKCNFPTLWNLVLLCPSRWLKKVIKTCVGCLHHAEGQHSEHNIPISHRPYLKQRDKRRFLIDCRKPRRTDLLSLLAHSCPGISYLVGEECKYMVVLSQNKEIGSRFASDKGMLAVFTINTMQNKIRTGPLEAIMKAQQAVK